MNFNRHLDLEGQHAFLGASKYQWINYDEETLRLRYKNSWSPTIGTVLHELAKRLIEERIKVNKTDQKMVYMYLVINNIPKYAIDMDFIFVNFMQYVNDAIGFRMTPEVVLKYSERCFGTTDAINFNEKTNFLRIHDYKSGSTVAKIEQLLIYAALFCLEYNYRPGEIKVELRIYQNENILIHQPTADEIAHIMDKIITSDKTIEMI